MTPPSPPSSPWASAQDAFLRIFGEEATHRSRAPGRVNLIGEHIDYNGLPVFPMALQKEVVIALRPRDDDRVVLHNTDASHGPIDFRIEPGIAPDPAGAWGNYVKAPAEELARRHAIWQGFEGVLASSLPAASGLSSSSAIVNAVGLALARVNDVAGTPVELAESMARAERYVGTEGGGMDQAISMGARARYAARIDFAPLRLRHVRVPDDWCFVVADSGRRAEKSGAARSAYNQRRAECAEALLVVSGQAATRGATEKLYPSFPQLIDAIDPGALVSFAEGVLDGNLLRRFRHVVTETERVHRAVDRMMAADTLGFGALMDASHASLRTDFRVSSPELDELVVIAREGGASGARLTGAGFGGSIVALADRWTVGGVLETLVAEYYEPRGMIDDLDTHLFVAVPSAGATYETLAGVGSVGQTDPR